MNYKNTTMIPNVFYDIYLKILSEKEIKVLLVILRQTIGWIDRNGERKTRDWISHKYFMNKTGLSLKSVSQAISQLIKKKLVYAQTIDGVPLNIGLHRKGRGRIYYSCTLRRKVNSSYYKGSIQHEIGKIVLGNRKNLLATKLTQTKLKKQINEKSIHKIKKQTDMERYLQIVNSPPNRKS